MQSLAAYSFDAVVEDPEARIARIDALVADWLAHKGAEDPLAAEGEFESLTGDGTGHFFRDRFESSVGVATKIELVETAHTGATFSTTIQVASQQTKVTLYATLNASPGLSRVAPVRISPLCPWVVRQLVERFDDWKFGGQELPVGRSFDATSETGVAMLCSAIRSTGRRLPLIVVSTDADEQVWHEVHSRAANQLIALADVAFVNEESSWHLTDKLGPRDSCFLGAIRLYWPALRRDGGYESITWLPARLAAYGGDDAGMNRFLSVLRRVVMSTAALTMPEPTIIREIQNATARERLLAMEGAAREEQLSSIIEENANLSKQLEDAQKTIADLKWKLAYASRDEPAAEAATEAEGDAEVIEHRPPPETGEIRYYKKIGSGGGVDTVVASKACQHKSSNWKPAFKGDQAEKGIAKFEGRDDWKSIAHCSTCTGGGRWRVTW